MISCAVRVIKKILFDTEGVMDRDKFISHAMSVIDDLHNNPLYSDYFEKVNSGLVTLKLFQYITIGIIVVLLVRFRTFEENSCSKTNKIILVLSGLTLIGMIVYECINYEYMSVGVDSVPIGFQLVFLLVIVLFYIRRML